MSFNWLLVRGASADPLSLKFAALQNKQNIAENEIFKPERARPKIISKYTEDLVPVQDPFSFQQLRYVNNLHYFGPFEPDGVHLKYWCRFNHIARQMHDHSFSNNLTTPVGNPILCAGPSDGVKGGSIVTRINTRDTVDYFYTPDSADLQMANMGDGFSIYLEFMAEQIGTSLFSTPMNKGIKPAGFKRAGIKLSGLYPSPPHQSMLRMKTDTSTGSNGHMIKIGLNGELKIFVRRAATTRNFITPPNKITIGNYYAVCVVYDGSDNSFDVRINNEPQTDAADETIPFPTGHSLSMFHGIGVNQNQETFVGRLKDSRHYNDFLFTNSMMDNIWNNKRSISPIPYGHLSVAGTSRFNSHVYAGGYDPIAYDGTGFETI